MSLPYKKIIEDCPLLTVDDSDSDAELRWEVAFIVGFLSLAAVGIFAQEPSHLN